jgi:hypothetical protein
MDVSNNFTEQYLEMYRRFRVTTHNRSCVALRVVCHN